MSLYTRNSNKCFKCFIMLEVHLRSSDDALTANYQAQKGLKSQYWGLKLGLVPGVSATGEQLLSIIDRFLILPSNNSGIM